jgi:hypothetical protein
MGDLGAVRAAHLQPAGTEDRDVQRAVGAAGRALDGAAADRGGGGAGALGDALRRQARGRVEQVPESDAQALVAGGVGVGDVVGQRIEPVLLCGHACGRGVHAFEHLPPVVGRAELILSQFAY